jgi:hypothetical protein
MDLAMVSLFNTPVTLSLFYPKGFSGTDRTWYLSGFILPIVIQCVLDNKEAKYLGGRRPRMSEILCPVLAIIAYKY